MFSVARVRLSRQVLVSLNATFYVCWIRESRLRLPAWIDFAHASLGFPRQARRIFQSIELRGSRFAGSAETSASAAAARATPSAGISRAADPDCSGASARFSVGVTLDKVEQFLFVRLDILVAGKIAEFQVVCEKSHLESIADKREGNLQPIVDLLLNSIHDLLFTQISKELEHSFETVDHSYPQWLSKRSYRETV
jgi:hypothetical protein